MSAKSNGFRLPASTVIKGVRYKIIVKADLKDDDGVPCMGLFDKDGKSIYIDAELKGDTRKQTFLHEYFHAYLYETHIGEGLESQLEEAVVEALSQSMTEKFNISWKRKNKKV